MTRFSRIAGCLALMLASSGCATLGTNVEGSFSCRAPKGDCAPTRVIDDRAAAELGIDRVMASGPMQRRQIGVGVGIGVGVADGDPARTAERTLRIVFPAHVDEAGTLHEEAAAWAVIEHPRWIAELRSPPGETAQPPLLRQLARLLRDARDAARAAAERAAANQSDATPTADAPYGPALAGSAEPDSASPFTATVPDPTLPLASPLVLPSTAREAVAGASAPAVEGFDMSLLPHARTPRPDGAASAPSYPSAAAIDQAHQAKRDAASPAPIQLPSNGEHR